jgi:hypothetical protein
VVSSVGGGSLRDRKNRNCKFVLEYHRRKLPTTRLFTAMYTAPEGMVMQQKKLLTDSCIYYPSDLLLRSCIFSWRLTCGHVEV